MLLADMPPPARPIAIVPLGAPAEQRALALAQDLRRRGLTIELGFSGNMGKRLKRADKLNARAAVILGDDELQRGVAAVRDLDAGAQEEVALDRLEDALARFA